MNEQIDKQSKQPNLKLSLPYSPQEVIDLSDGDSNSVFSLDNKYIYKKYFAQHQMHQETAGYLIFNSLSSFGVPMILDKGDDYVLFEYIASDSCFHKHYQEGALTKTQAAQKAASFVAEVYWKYRYYNRQKIQLFPYISWTDRLVDIASKTQKNDAIYQNVLSPDQYKLLKQSFTQIAALRVDARQLSFLHRDIHLDNILIKKDTVGRDSNYIIDFEHCMEGPIELEFQNAIFWNDDWSLPMDVVREELATKHGVPYSLKNEKDLLPVYYLDQLNLAVERNDHAKILLLANLYDQRYQEL